VAKAIVEATAQAAPTVIPVPPTPTPTATLVPPSPMPTATMNIAATVEARVAEERAKTAEADSVAMIEATVQAIFLPEQGRIAFESDLDCYHEIYVMNADGSGQTRLTDTDDLNLSPSWSPDGSRIAFMSNRDGNTEINVMNADGSGQTRLTDTDNVNHSPSWSPDGSRIAFTSDRDGYGEIYVMNADGSGQTRLTDTDDLNYSPHHSPSWSPDGSRIVLALPTTTATPTPTSTATLVPLTATPTPSPTPTLSSTSTSKPMATPIADTGGGTITSGEVKLAAIDIPEDKDQWTFDGIAGQLVTISLKAQSPDLKAIVHLQSPTTGYPEEYDFSVEKGKNVFIDRWRLLETGTYTVEIGDLEQGTGSYSLQLTVEAPP
jgi:dipeptidyl aminopeptidase/acylaminoacyl peptidase